MRSIAGRDGPLTFEVTIASLRHLRRTLGVDLLKPSAPRDGTPLVAALATDIELFVDVLYVLCAREREIGEEEFAAQLSTATAYQSAREEFLAEWIDFFLRCGQDAAAAELRKQIEGIQAGIQAAFEKITATDVAKHAREKIESIDFDAIVSKSIRGS